MSEVITGTSEYRLTRLLSEGGMGSVYEAVQHGVEGFHKQVAIKTILEELGTHEEFVNMFIGEAKLVADLVHENIIHVYQLGRTGDMLYIVMEYIDGIDLKEFIARHHELGKEIPVDFCTFIASRVCRALEYAHHKTDMDGNLLGVVHRDVSPRNIMITRQGVVKLGDFGIAKAQHYLANHEGDILMGKAQYMSPEQADYKETDGRSDLFSLGVVFYELLTGEAIFNSDDTMVTLRNVSRAQIPHIKKHKDDVPDDLAEIIMRALQRNPAKRFQSANEMGYALEYYMYHDRFGPTNVTLENYLLEIFPEIVRSVPKKFESPSTSMDIGMQATLIIHDDGTTEVNPGGNDE